MTAQQHAQKFQCATSPYNYGMSIHSGTEAIIHMLRTRTDADSSLVLTKIDCVGAYDYIFRNSMF